jgi:hypothetical protein
MEANRGDVHRGAARAEITPWGRGWFRASWAVILRPGLWWVAARQLGRVARPGWWRRAPFLPLPEAGYARFRVETAYGPDGVVRGGDLVSYLRWCRETSARR